MIYILKANDRVKIGYTDDPSKRISEIQTSSPYKLEVLLITDGNRDKEKELQSRFYEYRRTGEWFEFEKPIRDYIENNVHRDRKYEFGFVTEDFSGNEQILRIRTKHNLSLTELGEGLNMTRQGAQQLQQREKDGSITIKVLQKVAEVLGYSFEYRFVPKRKDSNA